MKTITDFEIINHGIENSQYFQGCGTSFGKYKDCTTGCGNDFIGALEDALESLSQMDYFADAELEQRIAKDLGAESYDKLAALDGIGYSVEDYLMEDPDNLDENGDVNWDGNKLYYYVSIRVK